MKRHSIIFGCSPIRQTSTNVACQPLLWMMDFVLAYKTPGDRSLDIHRIHIRNKMHYYLLENWKKCYKMFTQLKNIFKINISPLVVFLPVIRYHNVLDMIFKTTRGLQNSARSSKQSIGISILQSFIDSKQNEIKLIFTKMSKYINYRRI